MTLLQTKVKAVALISSGLDSLLAAKIVKDLDIDVQGVHFFFQFDSINKEDREREIEKTAGPLNIPVSIVDISEDFLDILINPEHGYGSQINPCIDCRLHMLHKAQKMMMQIGAQFIVTGEIVGQRPMTQNKPTLFHIDKASGLKGRILRPLSAKLLPPTLPEEKGWIDRNKLYGLSGRSRKPQLAMAEELGISHYSQPGVGCILTDPGYAKRVKSLFSHKQKKEITVEELKLLRFGRHFWPKDNLQVIVGRDEKDNLSLEAFQSGRWVFYPLDHQGPLVLAVGIKYESEIKLIAGITARYSSGNKSSPLRIKYKGNGKEGTILGTPIPDSELEKWRV